MASAIRNARLFDEKVRALRNLEILQEITNVLNSDLDLDALLERIARRSVEAVRPAQMGAVLLYDGGTLRGAVELRLPAARRRWRAVRLAFHEGLPGQRVRERPGPPRALALRRAEAARHAVPPSAEAAGERRAAAARSACPIALPQEKLGVLLLESATGPTRSSPTTCASRPPWPTRRPSPSATRCACAASWRWTASARSYLSNVSHELRTPLTVIQGYLEALARRGRRGRAGRPLPARRPGADASGWAA